MPITDYFFFHFFFISSCLTMCADSEVLWTVSSQHAVCAKPFWPIGPSYAHFSNAQLAALPLHCALFTPGLAGTEIQMHCDFSRGQH